MPPILDAHKNFAYSKVAVAPTPGASGLTLTLLTGEGVNMPPTPFNATVWPEDNIPKASNAEIVRVTDVTGDVVTMQRTQESSNARTIVVGDQFAQTITEKMLAAIEAALAPPGIYVPYAGFVAPNGWLMWDGTDLTVSRTIYATLFGALSILQNGNTTSGSVSITGLTDTSQMRVGAAIEGTGVPAGATVATIASATSITISANATATATNQMRVMNWGGGNGATTFNLPKIAGRTLVARGSHADVAKAGLDDGLTIGSRRPKHKTSITDPTHGHGISDPTHSHSITVNAGNLVQGATDAPGTGGSFGSSVVGVSGSASASATGVTVVAGSTGITAGPQTGSEPTDTVAHLVTNYIIKT